MEVVASSLKNFFFALPSICPCYLGKQSKIGPNFSEDLFFFCSSPNFGRKIGPNLSEDLYKFFKLFKFFTQFWEPGVYLCTPWKTFSMRPCIKVFIFVCFSPFVVICSVSQTSGYSYHFALNHILVSVITISEMQVCCFVFYNFLIFAYAGRRGLHTHENLQK